MYKLKEFLYKFFSPKGIKSISYISFLISILIMLFEAYILFLPVNETYNKRPEIYTKENAYTKVYYNVDGSIDALKTICLKIEKGELKSNSDSILKYKYSYDDNSVYIIFDTSLIVNESLNEIKEAYKAKYDDTEVKVNASSILIYIASLKGENIDVIIDRYHEKSLSTIENELSSVRYSDIYMLDDEDAYVMLFEKNSFYIEFPYEGSFINDSMTYAECENIKSFDINDISSLNEMMRLFSLNLGARYSKNAGIIYLGNCLIYTVIFPLILALILFLALRKRNDLKRFKEYYNMVAISSILPLVISFILSWFILNKAGFVYLAVLSLYSVFAIYGSISREKA